MEYNNRILIVDDNHSIHQDFQKILCPYRSEALRALDDLEQEIFGAALTEEKNGCETTTYTMDSAYQGLEAIEMVTKAANEGRPYALIFMDVRMPPGPDGIETIARIWQHYPYVEMVICTAHADYSWDDIIARLGATDNLLFLKKPLRKTNGALCTTTAKTVPSAINIQTPGRGSGPPEPASFTPGTACSHLQPSIILPGA